MNFLEFMNFVNLELKLHIVKCLRLEESFLGIHELCVKFQIYLQHFF